MRSALIWDFGFFLGEWNLPGLHNRNSQTCIPCLLHIPATLRYLLGYSIGFLSNVFSTQFWLWCWWTTLATCHEDLTARDITSLHPWITGRTSRSSRTRSTGLWFWWTENIIETISGPTHSHLCSIGYALGWGERRYSEIPQHCNIFIIMFYMILVPNIKGRKVPCLILLDMNWNVLTW